MLSILEAYELFKKKFPEAKGETIHDWGEYYTCNMYIDGDTADDEYTIDKKTGDIKKRDFLEYMDAVSKVSLDDIKAYKISDLLQKDS